MLVPERISQLLHKLLGDGIETAILLQTNGALLGMAGATTLGPNIKVDEVMAVAANVFENYSIATFEDDKQNGTEGEMDDVVDSLSLEFENARLAVVKISENVILMGCGQDVEAGYLNFKLHEVQGFLASQLEEHERSLQLDD